MADTDIERKSWDQPAEAQLCEVDGHARGAP